MSMVDKLDDPTRDALGKFILKQRASRLKRFFQLPLVSRPTTATMEAAMRQQEDAALLAFSGKLPEPDAFDELYPKGYKHAKIELKFKRGNKK